MRYLLFFTLFSFPSFAGIGIISDLDDTIKITNVQSIPGMVASVLKKQTFTGMPEFFNEARTYTDELHILSASPGFIKKSVLRTLNSNGIKFDSVSYKNPFKKEDKIAYKLRIIKDILDSSTNNFILIGDDVDKDPEVFVKAMELYPERIVTTYIHVVRNREMPEGTTRYWTSSDLAMREMQEGRMSIESAEKVLDTNLSEDNFHQMIPSFAHCPKTAENWTWKLETSLKDKASKLIDSLLSYCSSRK